MKKAKIYTLNCPITNEVKYIGKTESELSKRLNQHLYYIKKVNKKNNWIKSLLKKDLKPKIELLEEVELDDWQFWEMYWISQFKAWGFNLKNSSEGGMGGKTKWYSGENHHYYGKKAKESRRKNISQALSGRVIKESSREKMSNPVLQFDLDGILIKEWSGVSKASREMNIKQSNISENCQNNRKTAGGYVWKYKNSDKIKKIKHQILSDEDIKIIRSEYKSGKYNQRELSEKFKVSSTYIGRIINNKRR